MLRVSGPEELDFIDQLLRVISVALNSGKEVPSWPTTMACPRTKEGDALPVQGAAAASSQGSVPDPVLLLGR